MAESVKHKESGDRKKHDPTSVGGGESPTAGRSQSHESTGSGRSSDESDRRPYEARPGQTGKPLTMGSNGGGDAEIEKDGMEQSINRGEMQERKAS